MERNPASSRRLARPKKSHCVRKRDGGRWVDGWMTLDRVCRVLPCMFGCMKLLRKLIRKLHFEFSTTTSSKYYLEPTRRTSFWRSKLTARPASFATVRSSRLSHSEKGGDHR